VLVVLAVAQAEVLEQMVQILFLTQLPLLVVVAAEVIQAQAPALALVVVLVAVVQIETPQVEVLA
jgi:hypothetical protein